ncbi:hypothetical protein [Methanovulcanius yangii]|uniref:hypothetical protein n=1 Tax=Methanovulcanius yangii TaxID=1789227 RepID=UPI0029C9FE34|nr:hypothetical protein [Methanovulcanius yangii]
MPIISPDEITILERKATYEGGGGVKIPGTKTGTIYLTDKRFIFEYSDGLISKRTFTPLDISVSQIRNVNGEGMIAKKLVVEFEKNGGATGRVKFSTNGVDEWIKEIQVCIFDKN